MCAASRRERTGPCRNANFHAGGSSKAKKSGAWIQRGRRLKGIETMNGNDSKTPLTGRDALIVTDVQNDFLPGGRLAIPGGDEVIPPLNACIEIFHRAALPIFAVRDWHPPGHCSFRERGGPWPVHCIAGSPEAEFAESLALPSDVRVVSKATHPDKEAYSGFAGTELAERLKAEDVDTLFIGGLATDYCILNTARDALRLGFRVYVLEDAVRAVDVRPGDGDKALAEMQRAGARLTRSDRIAA
jgi:nicotinamidase/pyrazinamidase